MDSKLESGSRRNEVSIDPYRQSQPPQGSPGKLKNLPNEMLEVIFSHLTRENQQEVRRVSSRWNANIISQVRNEQREKLKNLMGEGIEYLEKEALLLKEKPDSLEKITNLGEIEAAIEEKITNLDEIEAAAKEKTKTLGEIEAAINTNTTILKNNPVLPTMSLLQVKNNFRSIKELLAENFKNLSKENIEAFKNNFNAADMPIGFDDFFVLVEFHRDLHEANKKTDPEEKSQALFLLTKSSIAKGWYGKAISILSSIPISTTRGLALKAILKSLIEKGRCDEAIKLADNIPFESKRLQKRKGDVIFFVVKVLFNKGYIDRSVNVATYTSLPGYRDRMLETIIKQLLLANNADKALEVASGMPKGSKIRDFSFSIIADHLKNSGDLPKALEAAGNIINEQRKDEAILSIKLLN